MQIYKLYLFIYGRGLFWGMRTFQKNTTAEHTHSEMLLKQNKDC